MLQELGGWASAEMVQRYAHLATEHLSHWVDRRCGLRAVKSYYEFATLKERATKVVAQVLEYWRARQESNPRPPGS